MLEEAPRQENISLLTHITKGQEKPKHFERWQGNIKQSVIKVYNHQTNRVSDKILKENNKGLYFEAVRHRRGNTKKRYYIHDFNTKNNHE